jgi:hypothetical protein
MSLPLAFIPVRACDGSRIEEAVEEFRVLEGMGFKPEDCIAAVVKHPGSLDQQVVMLLPG